MSYLSSLPGDGGLAETFRAYPHTARPLLDLHEAVMRAPSPFTPAERELMAAYVSGLNRCEFCHDSHVAAAGALGVPEQTAAAALADLDSAPVDERLKPVLRYLGKLPRPRPRSPRPTPRRCWRPAGTSRLCTTRSWCVPCSAL